MLQLGTVMLLGPAMLLLALQCSCLAQKRRCRQCIAPAPRSSQSKSQQWEDNAAALPRNASTVPGPVAIFLFFILLWQLYLITSLDSSILFYHVTRSCYSIGTVLSDFPQQLDPLDDRIYFELC